MLMTRKSMAAAVARTVQHRFATISMLALNPLHAGWDQTVSNSTPPKRSSCGVFHPATVIHFPLLVIDTLSVDSVTSVRDLCVDLEWTLTVDGHALVSACQFLLRRPTTNTLYPSIVAAFVVGNTDGDVHLVEGRLL